jgi:hypothetical protein
MLNPSWDVSENRKPKLKAKSLPINKEQLCEIKKLTTKFYTK